MESTGSKIFFSENTPKILRSKFPIFCCFFFQKTPDSCSKRIYVQTYRTGYIEQASLIKDYIYFECIYCIEDIFCMVEQKTLNIGIITIFIDNFTLSIQFHFIVFFILIYNRIKNPI